MSLSRARLRVAVSWLGRLSLPAVPPFHNRSLLMRMTGAWCRGLTAQIALAAAVVLAACDSPTGGRLAACRAAGWHTSRKGPSGRRTRRTRRTRSWAWASRSQRPPK